METVSGESLAGSLLPALVQCFGIIVIGYFFGHCKILDNRGANGLCIFLQYLALPALIFTSLATISFSNINWQFVMSVLVAKVCIFVAVAFTTMILTKPTHLGKAGIYAIAATQSNDLALGYPLMVSLYKNFHSTYPLLLYIIAPIQLLLLNPVGFVMLEINKQSTNSAVNGNILFNILKGIFLNPVVIATALGIIWNFAFYHTILPVVSQLLEALGSVFSTVALFALGHNMSLGFEEIRRYFSLTPALIVVTKILLLPLLLEQVVMCFVKEPTETQGLSSFGFLYGTIPCAPTVFIYAKQYDVSVDVITSTTVYGTVFSAPLMLASATMISLTQHGFENIDYYIRETTCFVGVINLVCCLFLFFKFISGRLWQNVCFTGVIFLVVSQTIMSVSAILLFFNNNYVVYVYNLLSLVGVFSTYMFAVNLAVILFLLQWRSLCYILRYSAYIYIFGFSVPMLISVILSASLIPSGEKTLNLNSPSRKPQLIAILAISLITFLATVAFLIFQHVRMSMASHVSNSTSENSLNINYRQDTSENETLLRSNVSNSSLECHTQCIQNGFIVSPRIVDIEDAGNGIRYGATNTCDNNLQQSNIYSDICKWHHSCNSEQRQHCINEVQDYRRQSASVEVDLNAYGHCIKYVIVLLCLCSAMLVNITMCISSLLTQKSNGILVELRFLNVILQNCQGIIFFCLFGLSGVMSTLCCRGWVTFRQRLATENENHT